MSVSDVSTAVLSQWVLAVSWRFGFFLACDKNWRFCLGGLFGFFFFWVNCDCNGGCCCGCGNGFVLSFLFCGRLWLPRWWWWWW